jgi:hypothetical protein
MPEAHPCLGLTKKRGDAAIPKGRQEILKRGDAAGPKWAKDDP